MLPTTINHTMNLISPIINEGIIKPLASGILEGIITGTTVEELVVSIRQHLLVCEPPKVHTQVGVPNAIRSTTITKSADGFVPQKNGNRYITDPTKICDYLFKRGANEGKQCIKAALIDYHRCTTHWKSGNKTTTTSTRSKAAAPMGLPKGGVPGMRASTAAVQIKLLPYKKPLYLTEIAGIVGQVIVNFVDATVGGVAMRVVTVPGNPEINRELTDDEKMLVNSVGLSTPNTASSAVPEVPTIGLAAPALPVKIPGMTLPVTLGSNVMTLPTAPGMTLPVAPVATLPVTPTMTLPVTPTMTLPVTPTMTLPVTPTVSSGGNDLSSLAAIIGGT